MPPERRSKNSKRHGSKFAFYLDENVPVSVAQVLRSLGHNVELAAETKPGATDVAQLVYATKQQRILVTLDRDFRSTMFPQDRLINSPGVVVLSTDDFAIKTFERLTKLMVKALTSRSLAGRICLVSTAGAKILKKFEISP